MVMRWKNLRKSQNVEHRGGNGGGRRMGGGGGRPIAMGGGCGTIILLLILGAVFGINPMSLFNQGGGGGSVSTPQQHRQSVPQTTSSARGEFQDFASRIKGSCEDVWTNIFAQAGKQYRPAKMVTYNGATRMRTGGVADARMGPFYLPAEETIYLDVAFFQQMKSQFRAGGDFAYAYVIAHEGAHHVQHLLGQTKRVHGQKGRVSDTVYNQLSVRLELQADFLAGVWAHYADQQHRQDHNGLPMMQEGDIQEAMRAAKAIGDDALQRQAGGRIIEDSFTHGTSEQRLNWFMKGFRTGDINQGDTFSIPYNRL